MRAAACLCRSILRGTEKSVPRSDRAYKAPGDPGKQYQRLATATVVVTAATGAEAGQKQDPDQPFTAVIAAAAIVVAQQPAAVVVTAATAAEQQQDDPDAAVAEDTVTTVVIAAGIIAAAICSS